MKIKDICIFLFIGIFLPYVYSQRENMGMRQGRPPFPSFNRMQGNRFRGGQRFPPSDQQGSNRNFANSRRRAQVQSHRQQQQQSRGRSEIIIEFRNNGAQQGQTSMGPRQAGRSRGGPQSRSNSARNNDHFDNSLHASDQNWGSNSQNRNSFDSRPSNQGRSHSRQNDLNNRHDSFPRDQSNQNSRLVNNDVNFGSNQNSRIANNDVHFGSNQNSRIANNDVNFGSNQNSRFANNDVNFGFNQNSRIGNNDVHFGSNQNSRIANNDVNFGSNNHIDNRNNNDFGVSSNRNTNEGHGNNVRNSGPGNFNDNHIGNGQSQNFQNGHSNGNNGQFHQNNNNLDNSINHFDVRQTGNHINNNNIQSSNSLNTHNSHTGSQSGHLVNNQNIRPQNSLNHPLQSGPIDVNLNSEVLGSVNAIQQNKHSLVINQQGGHSVANHFGNSVSQGIQGGVSQGIQGANIGNGQLSVSSVASTNVNQRLPVNNAHQQMTGHQQNIDTNTLNLINGLLSVPLNQAHQSQGKHSNVNQNVALSTVGGIQLGNTSPNVNIGHTQQAVTANSQNNHILTAIDQGLGGQGRTSVSHPHAAGTASGLPVDINHTIESLSSIIASNISPGLKTLSSEKSIGNQSHVKNTVDHGLRTNNGQTGSGSLTAAIRPVIEPIEIDYEEILQRAMTRKILGGL